MAILRFLPLAILAPILHATEPKIQVISGYPDNLRLEDMDGDGLKDLVYFSTWGTASTVRNLGNRQFSTLSHPYISQGSNSSAQGQAQCVEIQPGDHRIYFSQYTWDSSAQGDTNFQYTPLTVPIDGNGYGERTPLATDSPYLWDAIDLDKDHQTEFIFSANAGSLTIMDRLTDGTYSPTVIALSQLPAASRLAASQVADFDNDGNLDLLIPDDDHSQMLLYRRTGVRTFDPTPVMISGSSEFQIADLNGDGLPDVYISWSNQIRYSLNSGNFTFDPPITSPYAGGNPSYQGHLYQIQQSQSGPAILYSARSEDSTVAVESFRFGTWELVSQSDIDLSSLQLGPSGSNYVNEISDLDSDGHPDVILRIQPSSSNFSYYRTPPNYFVSWGSNHGFSAPAAILKGSVAPQQIIAANFNQQSAPDLIRGPDSDGYFWFYANSGTGTFEQKTRLDSLGRMNGSFLTPSIATIHKGDMDQDGILDLVVEYQCWVNSYVRSAYGVAKGNGDGTFTTPVLPNHSFTTVSSVVSGIDSLVDWDGDGDLDLIADGTWRENINGSFASEIHPLISGESIMDGLGNFITKVYTRTGDVDGDGHPDVISLIYRNLGPADGLSIGGLNSYKTSFAVAFNDGLGGIAEIAEVPVSLQARDVLGNPVIYDLQIADLNHDGIPDLCYDYHQGYDVLGNPVSTTRWLRNPGGANARNPASWLSLAFGAPSLPTTLHPESDFDGDGRKDWANGFGYVRPTAAGPVVSDLYDFTYGASFPEYHISRRATDFDGDGDADILIYDDYHTWIVTNDIVNDDSEITRYLVSQGVAGQLAIARADADGDGRDNVTELLMGENPLVANAGTDNPLTVSLIPSDGHHALSYRTPGYASTLGLGYQVEHSQNLVDWQPLSGATPSILNSSNGWNYLQLPLSCSGSCGYYRVRGFLNQ